MNQESDFHLIVMFILAYRGYLNQPKKKRIGNSCPPGLNGALPFGCKTFISGIYIVVVNTPESSTGKKITTSLSPLDTKKAPKWGLFFKSY